MNKLRKIVVSILASLMLSTSVCFASDVDLLAADKQIAIKKTMATEVMTGTTKGFEPNKSLTRAEAAAIMTRVSGVSKAECDAKKGKTIFSDVTAGSWSSGYITIANDLKLVKGMGNNIFAPNSNVTVAQFKTMAIRALGAGRYVDSEGKWPNNYISFAKKHGIGEGIDGLDNQNITRGDAAMILEDIFNEDMFEGSRTLVGKNILNTNMNMSDYHIVSSDKMPDGSFNITYEEAGTKYAQRAFLDAGVKADTLTNCDVLSKKIGTANVIVLIYKIGESTESTEKLQ